MSYTAPSLKETCPDDVRQPSSSFSQKALLPLPQTEEQGITNSLIEAQD